MFINKGRVMFHYICKTIFIPLLCLLLSSCTTIPQEPMSVISRCDGTYPGEFKKTSDHFVIELQDVNLSTLSLHRDIEPLTGGDRVMVYFTLSQSADYTLYVYREAWVLMTYTTAKGWYNKELGRGKVSKIKRRDFKGVQITFDQALMPETIAKCWNCQM